MTSEFDSTVFSSFPSLLFLFLSFSRGGGDLVYVAATAMSPLARHIPTRLLC